jgi:hypothetical protein
MNRTLKRPMFRIGGSAGTGITSGLNQPRKQYKQGTPNPYDMGAFSPGSLPGFLTSFGLDLLSRPPSGGLLSTIAQSAKGPFDRYQAGQASAMKTASDRAFAEKLAKEEREFEEGQLDKKLAAQERIANIKTTDTTERIQAIADTKYDGDTIKAAREVNFPDEIYPNLISEYGEQTVATSVIDTSGLQKQKDINRFVKQNPQLARQVVYDVRTGKAVRFGLVNGKYTIQPADPKDVDDTNFAMPDPDKPTPGLFGQQTKEGRELKEILPDFRDSGFDEDFYQ